ncbi:MAG TPA: LamG-like jellyroll fold domain-containing protein [Candidatus Limnocylindrales bacterium]|nr:LamG-like jellyroll fold domain-containing protein [Candidatus Limnocylindrales bacterium]
MFLERSPAPIEVIGGERGYLPSLGAELRSPRSVDALPRAATEDEALRTAYSRVVVGPDGTHTAEFFMGRINYLDSEGKWQPIDLSLTDEAGEYGKRTRANDVGVSLSSKGNTDRLAEIRSPHGTLRLRQVDRGVLAPITLPDQVRIPARPGSGEVSLIPVPEGLAFSVTLAEPGLANSYQFILDTGGLRAEVAPDGRGVLLRNADGEIAGTVSPPWAIDAIDSFAPETAVTTTLSTRIDPAPRPPLPTPSPVLATPTVETLAPILPGPTLPAEPTIAPDATAPVETPAADATTQPTEPEPTDLPLDTAAPESPSPTDPTAPDLTDGRLGPDEIVLTYTIDPAWLADPARVYPVVLDPTICLQYGQTGTPTGCSSVYTAGDILDHFVLSGMPNSWQTGWNRIRVGTDADSGDGGSYGVMRGLLYFPNLALEDGAQVTDASLQLYQNNNWGNGTQKVYFEQVSSGWNMQATWNNQPSVLSGSATTPVTVFASSGYLTQDVTSMVRSWYTRSRASWQPNFGIRVRQQTESQNEVRYASQRADNLDRRPRLSVSYVVPAAGIDFDPALGDNFVPTTMVAGKSTSLPVRVRNDAGFTFNLSGANPNDYYAFGYRWLDAAGRPLAISGFTSWKVVNLPTAINSGATSSIFNVAVDAPPVVGQFGLRLDLVHVRGGTNLWGSDWAKPSAYYARKKYSLDDSNTRWVGASVVERADFGVSVVSGGGTAIGDTSSVELPDGSSLGINLWSRNLRFDGAGGVGFSDRGGLLSLAYYYDSANRTDCTGILRACGWGTNFDEGFRSGAGVEGADYIYVDADGNRYLVAAAPSGQLISAAPVRLERVRHTIFDENWLTGWSGTASLIASGTAFSGGRVYQIAANNATGASTGAFPKIDLDHYPLGSFAVIRTGSATRGAIGFQIVNETTGASTWLAYTLGTDFAISGVTKKVALGGSITSWRHIQGRDIRADAVSQAIGTVNDNFSITAMKFWGTTESGNLQFDAIRFEGTKADIINDANLAWTANAGNSSLSTTDRHAGTGAIKVLPASEAASPNCVACRNDNLIVHPFVSWAWKKVGGDHVAFAFHVKNARTNASSTITYYAGPALAPGTYTNQLQISPTAPTEWMVVTRNLLDDARQVLGYYNDAEGGNSETPGAGPIADPVHLTGLRLIARDGNYALFDTSQLRSLTNLGASYAATVADDFELTERGGARRFFNRDGVMTLSTDPSGNSTRLTWTYDYSAQTISLATVRAASDGEPLASGTATRQLQVTYGTSSVRFTEALSGATGRYTDFARDASNNLVTVIPARRSAACAASGQASGCHKFSYASGSLLNRVTDPRDTGNNALSHTVTYSVSDPTAVRSESTATDQLRVQSYGSGGSIVRVRWQDGDGIAGIGSTQYARYTDLTPNGAVVAEYRPLPCVNANCSGGTTNPSTPTDKLVEYRTDGINNYSEEIRYRLTGNGGAMRTRRGTFAAAQVDNYSDPLTAGLTSWAQTAAQYAASSAAGNVDLHRTVYAYNSDGMPVAEASPFANEATGNVVTQTVVSRYDAANNLTESSDRAFVANGGFESGLVAWTTSGSATWEQSIVSSGFGSLKVTGTGSAVQNAQLLPGQTFRFQLQTRTGTGSGATFQVDYQRASDGTYQTLLPPTTQPATSWTASAYDLTIPVGGTGTVRTTLKIGSGSGTVYFDDVVALTSYAGASYHPDGRLDTEVDVLGRVTKYNYAATSGHPAIFITSSVENFKAGQPASADQNVTRSQTFDAWGRVLSSVDPDGVTETTAYAANRTDVASVSDGLGNTTQYQSYNAIGQLLSEQDPLGRVRTTSYDGLGNPVDETDFDGVVSRSLYDGVGRLTSRIENWTNGGVGTTGVNNVRTTWTFDELGRVTREVADSGVTGATSDYSYDLAGNKTSETVYPSGTSNGRTTTTYLGPAGVIVGTRGPINPSASAAPNCPGISPAVKCNNVSAVDLNGRTRSVTDAYGKVSITWHDFAGKPVREVDNYVAGGSSTASQNVTTLLRYDAADRVVAVTDPLGRVTSTTYDSLDRVVKMTRPDGTWLSTVFRPSGRVDMESSATATAGAEIWSKRVYDAAGRQTKTLAHFDTSATARLWVMSFEGGADGWSGASTGYFTASASTSVTSAQGDAHSGARALSVATGTGTSAGATVSLADATFKANRTYRVRARLRAPSGTTIQTFFGVDASGGDHAAFPSVIATGSWQVIDGTWTPTADRSAGVRFAARRSGSTSVTLRLDDIVIWDDSDALTNPSGFDWNIPSETAYDAAGRVIATVAAPGDPRTEGPMVTLSAHDDADRVTAVRVAAAPRYADVVAHAPTSLSHWRLDELSGTTAADQLNGRTMTISGGVTLGAPRGVVDQPSSAMTFDGSSGKLQAPFNASTWGITGDKLTMEAWFRTTRTTGKGNILRQSHYGLGFWLAQNGNVMEGVIYGSAQGRITASGYQDGNWHHIVATADGTTMRLYMDGVQVGSTPLSGNITTWNDNLAIGAIDSNAEWFSGDIDEVALYGEAVSADEVAMHYDAGRSSDRDLLSTYAYDALGNRTESIDPSGVSTRYEYDRRGNITSSTLNYVAGAGSTSSQNVKATFAYNNLDEMTAACAPRQVQAGCNPSTPSSSAWRYTFDALGHIVSETPPINTTGAPLSATTYVFDTAHGGARPVRTCDHSAGGSCASSTRYIDTSYDALARVTSVIHYTGLAGSGTQALRTESAYDATGQQTSVTYFEAGTQKDSLAFAYDDLGRQTVVSRSGTPVTTAAYNPDGTVASRIDHAISSTASTFIYDWRGLQTSATSPTYTGSTTFGWRLDGLLASRSWPTGGNVATYTYDRVKRPIESNELRSGASQAVFTRSFDRVGNVVSEGRTLSGISGTAGTGKQSFTYDALRRVTSSSLPGGLNEAYGYDANSNRVSWNDGVATTTYDFNESDELTAQHRSGVTRNYSYDAYGNMTSSAVASAGATSYSYDSQDRLTSIAPPSGGALSFTLDALGRHWTKSVGGTLADTYGYVGASEAVVHIAQSATDVRSAIDALGNRVATATSSGGFGWLLADLHGDVAGMLHGAGTSITDAFRYSAYGMTIAKATSTLPTPWRYQGRMLLNTADGSGVNTDLYDFIARAYDPALGAFTSLDTERGGALNPITLNRFLYAAANPETLVDPDGHFGEDLINWFQKETEKQVNNVVNGANFVLGFGEGVVDAAAGTANGLLELGKGAVGGTVNAIGCAANDRCRNTAISAVGQTVTNFTRDPGGNIRRAVDSAGNALGNGFNSLVNGTANWFQRAGDKLRTGDFRGAGQMSGRIGGEIGLSFVPVAGILSKAGLVGRLATAGNRVTSLAGRGSSAVGNLSRTIPAAGRASSAVTKAVTASKTYIGVAKHKVDTFTRGTACKMHSFAAHTLVATAAGLVAIGTLAVGDHVLAYDEATGVVAEHPISVVHINADPVTGTIAVGGEVIETTPEHPFYTLEEGWLDAEDLEIGMRVPSASDEPGVVTAVDFSGGPAIMYNLTVEVAHTYFVGEGEWLVHNCERVRDALGRFTSGNPGSRISEVAEADVWRAVRSKPGWDVLEGRVTVRSSTGRARVYDGAARSPRGRVIGLEVKQGTARRSPRQREFDRAVPRLKPPILTGAWAGRPIRRTALIRRD